MAGQLPTELIEHIFSLADHTDKQTCAAICLTNELGRQAVTPVMYQSVGITDGRLLPAERAHRLQLLCRTLLENPRLAALATDIKHWVDSASQEDCGRLDGSFALLVQRRLGEMNMPRALYGQVLTVLEDDQCETTEDDYLVLMLLLCNRATVLELLGELNVLRDMESLCYILGCVAEEEDDSEDGESSSSSDVSGEAESRQYGLYSIREVRLISEGLTRDGVKVDLGVEDIEPLLQFPNLHSVYASNLERTISKGFRSSLDLFRSNVKELKFSAFSAKIEDLEALLPACSGLQTLDVEFTTKDSAHRRFDWRDLGVALREFCPRIKHLRLDHERDVLMDDKDMYEMGGVRDDNVKSARLRGLGRLIELSHLTTLTLSKNALFGTRGSFAGYRASDASESDLEQKFGALDTEPSGRKLDAILPQSLRELTIICEDKYIGPWEVGLLDGPAVQHLDEMTIIDCQKDGWITKMEGPNAVQRQRDKERAARLVALAAQRAAMKAARERGSAASPAGARRGGV
ncbi:hypothetical protein LTR36_003692 [Oleoguttula mirabilis]|uniref:F-box domain-containing protein n=1 Tax=Oleoguttula mirabilis TaxID=1507867 RepID=A0AAV9JIX6_9PEZI|nr:hypothetical protein LTR36_003692 [Oleoguttula mirabilis]